MMLECTVQCVSLKSTSRIVNPSSASLSSSLQQLTHVPPTSAADVSPPPPPPPDEWCPPLLIRTDPNAPTSPLVLQLSICQSGGEGNGCGAGEEQKSLSSSSTACMAAAAAADHQHADDCIELRIITSARVLEVAAISENNYYGRAASSSSPPSVQQLHHGGGDDDDRIMHSAWDTIATLNGEAVGEEERITAVNSVATSHDGPCLELLPLYQHCLLINQSNACRLGWFNNNNDDGNSCSARTISALIRLSFFGRGLKKTWLAVRSIALVFHPSSVGAHIPSAPFALWRAIRECAASDGTTTSHVHHQSAAAEPCDPLARGGGGGLGGSAMMAMLMAKMMGSAFQAGDRLSGAEALFPSEVAPKPLEDASAQETVAVSGASDAHTVSAENDANDGCLSNSGDRYHEKEGCDVNAGDADEVRPHPIYGYGEKGQPLRMPPPTPAALMMKLMMGMGMTEGGGGGGAKRQEVALPSPPAMANPSSNDAERPLNNCSPSLSAPQEREEGTFTFVPVAPSPSVPSPLTSAASESRDAKDADSSSSRRSVPSSSSFPIIPPFMMTILQSTVKAAVEEAFSARGEGGGGGGGGGCGRGFSNAASCCGQCKVLGERVSTLEAQIVDLRAILASMPREAKGRPQQ